MSLMRISRAGISNKMDKSSLSHKALLCVGPGTGSTRRGFTLLELMVVIFILSTILIMAFPRIPLLSDQNLSRDARRLAATLRMLDERSTATRTYYRLWVNPTGDEMRLESSSDGLNFTAESGQKLQGLKLASGTDIEDIVLAGTGRIDSGEVAVIFNPRAGAEPFFLHLSSDERVLTLNYNPFSGRVKVLEGYV